MEVLEQGENKGSFKTVGDKEHSEIVKNYIEGAGMQKIALDKDRFTRTILVHIKSHNSAIKRAGFCPQCKRANSKFFCMEVVRSKTLENVRV